MADLIPWWQGLPQAPAPAQPMNIGQMITAQRLAQQLQLQKNEMQGYNALGALYQNPANLDANGNLKPAALAQLMTVSPQIGLNVQGHQIENMQRQAQLSMAATKVRDEHHSWLVDTVAAPAVSKYDDVLKQTGSTQAAQTAAQAVYSDGLQEVKADGRLTPQEAAALAPNFDYNRAKTNVLGRQGMAQQEQRQSAAAQSFAVQTDYGKTPPVQYRLYKDGHTTDITGNPYTPTGVAQGAKGDSALYTGTTPDGKTVTVRMSPTGGWQDVDTGNPVKGLTGIVKVGTQPQFAGGTVGNTTSNLHGDDYLKTLPSNLQFQVKALAEGRQQFPSGFALRSQYWQQMLQAVAQYDPSFDAVNYNARARTRQDFTSGQGARAITSFNTAIGHLGTLDKAAEQLGNRALPAYNTIANWTESAKGDPRVVRFNTAKQAVSDELTRAFRGTGGNVSDIRDWEKNLSSSNSPEQLHEAIRQAVELLRSRIDAVGQQYKRGMGTTADVMDLLTPAARKTLAALPGGSDLANDRSAVGGASAPPASSNAPAGQSGRDMPPPEAVAKLKAGVSTTFGNGQVWTLRDGKPVRVQ